MTHIVLEDVHVSYPVKVGGRERSTMAALASTASFGRIAADMKSLPRVQAIRGLSFRAEAGDRIAIVGRNGAGKSTLLKTVAGLMNPSQGKVDIEGTVLALLSLGGGLNTEKSARQNLRMMAKLLDIPSAEYDDFENDVYEFTELAEFFDMPLMTYSSGMLVRFMFGTMTYKSADIMVIDEIIGAGDARFFSKAQQRAEALFKTSKILLLSSHAAEVTYELCNRAIWLENGTIAMDGSPRDVWDAYRASLAA